MTEQEGVIKYQLDFQPSAARHYPHYQELNAWRSILYRLELIGQNVQRYGGLAYGNVSFRLPDSGQFVITGSQTGGLENLSDEHYSLILAADANRNHIAATGAIKPSSEALTHAAVYAANCDIKAVVHVHSAVIWQRYRALALPAVDAKIHYGTPAMAEAVLTLLARKPSASNPVFAMLGHEDGIVAFGPSITIASLELIRTLALAMQIAAQ